MKTKLLFIALLFSTTVSAQSLTDSLLLYYPFNGNFNDASGNGYHGTGTATFGSDSLGNASSAAYFNGTSQYVNFPNIAALKPPFPFSFSCWVYYDTLLSSGDRGVVFCTSFDNDIHSGAWMGRASTGTMSVTVGDATGVSSPSRRGRETSINLGTDKWHHVAAVVRSGNDIDLYVDCVLRNGNYGGTSAGNIVYTSGAGNLGRKDANGPSIPEYYFQGRVDEFRYWNRELTPTEVTTLCTMLTGVNEQGQQMEELTVYPNPTKEIININTLADLRNTTVEVFNSIGELVISQPYQSTISVKHLVAGMYTVNIKTLKGIYNVKFVKE